MNREAIWLAVRSEGPRTLLVLLAGLALGAVWASAEAGLVFALAGLSAHHIMAGARLRVWQQSPKNHDLPIGVGLWRDIYDGAVSRYKQARKRKRRLASIVKEFRASTNALPDAAVVLDEQGRTVWYNPAASQLLGLLTKRDMGQRISNLIRHPAFQRYMADPDDGSLGVEIPGIADPAHTLWVRLVPYGHSQRLLIARDITDRIRVEQMRRDFVSNASHELRTPLTVISGYLELMVGDASSAGHGMGQWADPLQQMQRQSKRMENIILDMLKLARLEGSARSSDFEMVDMPRLLNDAVREARDLSDGRHVIAAEITEGIALQGMPLELQSVAGNLLSNAVRYTPEGGRITLRWFLERDCPVLEVSDTGIGVAARDIPRLTERFYRSDVARSRETGGTGLGLAIVKHALERHRAHLEIRSAPGAGSRFRCVFDGGSSRTAVTGL